MTLLPNSIGPSMAAEDGTTAGDEFLWLEALHGKKASQWVQKQNKRTVASVAQGDDFQRIEREVLDILNNDTLITIGEQTRRLLLQFLAGSGQPAWLAAARHA